MENYADYEFYKNEYKQGSLSVDLFSKLIIKASRDIDLYVNRELTPYVINNLSDRDKWKLKYTACVLCDYFNGNGSIVDGDELNGKSISIDGVSISGGKDNIEQAGAKKQIETILMKYLPHELVRYL